MPKQLVKREVPPLEHAPIDRRPFRKDDVAGLLTCCIERQGITPDDVPLKDETHRLPALVLRAVPEQPRIEITVEDAIEPLPALPDIVLQDVNAVDRGNGQDGVTLKVELRLAVTLLR